MNKDQFVASIKQQYARIKTEMNPRIEEIKQMGQDFYEFNERDKHFTTALQALEKSKEELSATLQKNAQLGISELENKWKDLKIKLEQNR